MLGQSTLRAVSFREVSFRPRVVTHLGGRRSLTASAPVASDGSRPQGVRPDSHEREPVSTGGHVSDHAKQDEGRMSGVPASEEDSQGKSNPVLLNDLREAVCCSLSAAACQRDLSCRCRCQANACSTPCSCPSTRAVQPQKSRLHRHRRSARSRPHRRSSTARGRRPRPLPRPALRA